MRQCPKCKYSLPPGRWERCPVCKYLLPARLRQETRQTRGPIRLPGVGALVAAAAGMATCWSPSLSQLSICLNVAALALAGAGLRNCHKKGGDTSVGLVTAATGAGAAFMAGGVGLPPQSRLHETVHGGLLKLILAEIESWQQDRHFYSLPKSV